MNVRPAALEPAAAVAACIVGLPAQDVLSWYAERGRGGRLSVSGIDDRPRILEHHRTRTPEFAPNDICRWSLARTRFRWLFPIIVKPYGQRKGLGDPERIQVHRNGRGLSIGGDGPRQSLVAEILRNDNCENTPLAARQEVRGLTLIGPARLDSIVRSDGNVERFFLVSIEVTDKQAVGTVGILIPALKGTGYALSGIVHRCER